MRRGSREALMAIADVSVGIKTLDHWIDGKPVSSKSGRFATVWNPASGEAQARVGFASVAEVDAAVASAQEAFVEWRPSALSRRAEIIFKFRELADANRKRIAELITLE